MPMPPASVRHLTQGWRHNLYGWRSVINTTAWWLIAVVTLLIGYDIFAVLRWGYHGTISYDVLTAAKAYPVLPFAMGVVCGHLLWPQ